MAGLVVQFFCCGFDPIPRCLRDGAPRHVVQHHGHGCRIQSEMFRQLSQADRFGFGFRFFPQDALDPSQALRLANLAGETFPGKDALPLKEIHPGKERNPAGDGMLSVLIVE